MTTYNLEQFKTNNIKLISILDVKNLQKALVCNAGVLQNKKQNATQYYSDLLIAYRDYNPCDSKVKFSFNNDIYNFLQQQDLGFYLGIPSNYFNCIMHPHSGKASIYLKDDDTWMYKCFDKDCRFKIGDITKITECLTGLNRPKALQFMMDVYGVVLEKTQLQLEQERVIDSNIELLFNQNHLRSNYPELYIRIKKYIPQLLILHEFAKMNISLKEAMENKSVVFSAPIREISKKLIEQEESSSLNVVSKRNNILAFIGLLLKLSDSQVSADVVKDARDYAYENNYNNYENFYAVPSYDYQVLNTAEKKSQEFKDTAMTVRGFNRDMLINGFPKEESVKVYPRQRNYNVDLNYKKISDILKDLVCNSIKKCGYCLENDIYGNGYVIRGIKRRLNIFDSKIINMKRIEAIFKTCLPELINSYGFIRCRLTKELKEKFNIDIGIKGTPNIIYKNT